MILLRNSAIVEQATFDVILQGNYYKIKLRNIIFIVSDKMKDMLTVNQSQNEVSEDEERPSHVDGTIWSQRGCP